MFTYIGCTDEGATEYHCTSIGDLVTELGAAHGKDSPKPFEIKAIVTWAVDSTPGCQFRWRLGWIFRLDIDKAIQGIDAAPASGTPNT